MASGSVRSGAIGLAALLGLVPTVMQSTENLVWPSGNAPHALTRARVAVEVPADPGSILVGQTFIGALSGYGLVQGGWTDSPDNEGHAISWRLAGTIERVVGALANMGIYGTVWFLLRYSPVESRRRKIARAGTSLWLLVAVPAGLFSAWWITL